MISIALLECLLMGWEESGCRCYGKSPLSYSRRARHHSETHAPNHIFKSMTIAIHCIIPSMLPKDYGTDYDACVEILG
jgi:hypothetical protein